MFNYVFFDEELRDRFLDFLRDQNVVYSQKVDAIGASVIGVHEDLSNDLYDTIEARYDELSLEMADRLEGTSDALQTNRAGVRVTLSDGRPCTVRIDPDIMSRLLRVLTLEELQDLVTTIARAGENPDDRPICQGS